MSIHFIAKTTDYWLRVQIERGPIISLPYGLMVDRLEVKENREYFKILEGASTGKIASVQISAGKSYLTTGISHKHGATVRFNKKAQTLHIGGRGPFNAFSGGGHHGFTPIAAGTYLLAIPAYPSAQTRIAYNPFCRHHNVWFRIGTATTNTRFLHTGAISEGCVTVRQFIYDPPKGIPPAGFSDLPQIAKTAPGLLGLPLPPKPASCTNWDEMVDSLILCRLNNQAVGQLVVT